MGCKVSKAAAVHGGGGKSIKHSKRHKAPPPGLQESKSFDNTASPSSPSNIKNGGHPSSTRSNGAHQNGGSKSFDSAAEKKRVKAAAAAAANDNENHEAIYKLLQNAQALARNAWNCSNHHHHHHAPQQDPNYQEQGGEGEQDAEPLVSPMTNNSTNTSECWLDEQEQVYTRIMELCESAVAATANNSNNNNNTSRTATAKNNSKNNSSTSNMTTTSKQYQRMFTFQNGTTGETPLHMAVRLLDYPDHPNTSLVNVVHALIRAHAPAVGMTDYTGNLPLHYAMAPTSNHISSAGPNNSNNNNDNGSINSSGTLPASEWRTRSAVVQLLVAANVELSVQYMRRNNVIYKSRGGGGGHAGGGHAGCTPLYRALQMVPDDFDLHSATVEYIAMLTNVCSGATGLVVHDVDEDDDEDDGDEEDVAHGNSNSSSSNSNISMVGVGNAADGDRPLALLYRRFTRQFDLAEKFFDGDNSRREVVEHRRRYKTAAGNTWRIIESLLRLTVSSSSTHETRNSRANSNDMNNQNNNHIKEWKIVHRAVQVEAPPDLLRYIVETNAEDLTIPDHLGNLPIHYAAKSKPVNEPRYHQLSPNMMSSSSSKKNAVRTSFPAFYTKYVVDELLYKFPEAASMPDARGRLPFKLAVDSGKQWIGGGIKSLYDAHPAGLEQVNLDEHLTLKKVLQDDLLQMSSAHSTVGVAPTPRDHDQQQEQATTVTAATTQKSIVSSVGLNTPTSIVSSSGGIGGGDHDVIPDEQHDAIMLVQSPNVDISEVVCSMWAHEEDAGVQMLSCVAIARMIESTLASSSSPANDDAAVNDDVLRIALSAVAAVVNAMKAHPNEVIVQEKACHTLALLARTDGQREISFVALGAVGAVVGAMQAHVSDAGAQEEACSAIAEIIKYGGADRATIVASVSGLTALVNAIAAHPDAAGVQHQACRALRELTEYPHANLPELPRSQTEPLLLQAKLKFPNECQDAVDLILSRLSVS